MSWGTANVAVRPRRGSGAPRRRRALVYFLELAICFAVLGVFGAAFSSYVYESDRFLVKHVRFHGPNVLSEQEVLKVADVLRIGRDLDRDKLIHPHMVVRPPDLAKGPTANLLAEDIF